MFWKFTMFEFLHENGYQWDKDIRNGGAWAYWMFKICVKMDCPLDWTVYFNARGNDSECFEYLIKKFLVDEEFKNFYSSDDDGNYIYQRECEEEEGEEEDKCEDKNDLLLMILLSSINNR